MYTAATTNHFLSPHGVGTLEGTDVCAGQVGTPGQGQWIAFWVRVTDGTITEARFQTYGRPAIIACGSAICERLPGRSVKEAAELDAETLNEMLGGLPLGKEHCPAMAIAALRKALIGTDQCPIAR